MKISRSQLKQIIQEEIFGESGGMAGNFGGTAGALMESSANRVHLLKTVPDSAIQHQAAEFFLTLELTGKVVKVLVETIAIPDLIELMDKIPKLDTAAEEEQVV